VLFETPRRTLGIDSSLDLVRDVISRVQAAVLAGREPSQRIAVPQELSRRVDQLLAQDLDGDGRDDILLFAQPPARDKDKDRPREFQPVRAQLQSVHIWLSGTSAARADPVPR
jgi:hypothetical protein